MGYEANGAAATGEERRPSTVWALELELREAEEQLDALVRSGSASLADMAAALVRARALLSRRDALLRRGA